MNAYEGKTQAWQKVMAAYHRGMTYSHLWADCLFTGISSVPNDRNGRSLPDVYMYCSHGDSQPSERCHDRLTRAASGTGRSSPGSSSHGAASDSTVTSDPATTTSRDKKPLGMLIRGFPVRSSNSSVRDGLFHEYKRYGKVTSVHISGTGEDRQAIVSFKKSVILLILCF